MGWKLKHSSSDSNSLCQNELKHYYSNCANQQAQKKNTAELGFSSNVLPATEHITEFKWEADVFLKTIV